ncbi:hypothetical protein HF259_06220 [Rhizobium leguminosarum]|uniref:hypothetical protein n=1 Tax=Rhizobium leguminosarum TaxID=384 RepID=UPI001C923885|nr:hypothetical protein [Rhizobium leguminosarum]MBY2921034.1 hypothetical protein [Rhizobium leguminosarum]
MTEREREKIKLTANYRNGIAIAFLAIGGLTAGLRLINQQTPDWVSALAITAFAIIISLLLHYFARAALNDLP